MAEEPKDLMDELSDDAASQADAQLADRELRLIAETSFDWKKYRPAVGEEATYNALQEAVASATDHNRDIAQLRARIEALGDAGVALVKKVLATTSNFATSVGKIV